MSRVDVVNLTKRFGDLLVLDNISFSVGNGEFLCIVGPTGCGKTTFLNSLAHLYDIDAGRITIDGEDVDLQKHSIARFEAQLFRSVGGTVYYNGRKVRDLLQFHYGRNTFGSDAIDPETGGFYAFTGPYGVDNPTDITERDELEIVSSEPFPFNLMAIGLLYSITEVN